MKTFVLDENGQPLMPTTATKARKLLKNDGAVIVKYDPFTIQLTYQSRGYVQPVTLGIDRSTLVVLENVLYSTGWSMSASPFRLQI